MHHHFNHTTKGRKIMRKSAVQISLWDIYNGVSEAIEQHKPQLIRLLEEHIDFDRLIPASFKLAFYRHMGRKHIYHLESFIVVTSSLALGSPSFLTSTNALSVLSTQSSSKLLYSSTV